MTKLSWVTPPGTLSNLLIGIPTEVQVQAASAPVGSSIMYTLISGELPPGMTLSLDGLITGTPTYSTPSNNYFSTAEYKFIIRAKTSSGAVLDGSFSIIITNTVNRDFAWATPAGLLGTVPNGEFYSFRLLAESINSSNITYTLLSGELPAGLEIVQSDIAYDKTHTATQNIDVGNKLTFSEVVSIPIGAQVSGPNIPSGTVVTDVNFFTKTVTLSNSTTGLIRENTDISFYKVLFYAGTLAGVPTFLNPVVVDQSQEYKFTVRATTDRGHILDRSFSLIITNVYGPVISPTTEFLGTYFDGAYYSKQLAVAEINPNVQLQWSIVSGAMPSGLSLGQDGKISGYIQPLELVGNFGPAGLDGEEYTGTEVPAGKFIPGVTYSIKTIGDTDWVAIGAQVTDQKPLPTVKQEFIATGPGSGTGTAIVSGTEVVTDKQDFNEGPYDFNQLNQSLKYDFTVQVYDGANYDLQRYVIEIISRSGWTADSTNLVNDTYLTIDSLNNYIPILLNSTRTLPIARQDSYYAFKFDGYDFQNDTLIYNIANVSDTFDSGPFDPLEELPGNNGLSGSFDAYDPNRSATNNLPGLLLDSSTGWLYGKLDPQTSALETYSFGVIVSKIRNNITYSSPPIFFTLPVIGDVNNVITWTSPSDLGTIDNGTVSELSVSAVSMVGKPLVYTLVDEAGLPVSLPQGLTLLPSGDISGRASFEAFSLDTYTTTFDGSNTTIDRTFTFTVKAETTDGTAHSLQQFTLKLNIINSNPYENLYLVAMPKHDQRQLYNSIISDTDIFDPSIIYRPTDPWFGVRKNIEMLFASGLTSDTLDYYQNAIMHNHWTKRYTFDGIKTATVLDENYNVKYEVVYVEIMDPAENADHKGPALSIDLSNTNANPYIDENGVQYTTVYPNSSENMLTRLEMGVGYQDQSSLPPWMTSNQPDPTSANKFRTPLGYTKAAVLAYTKPGASKLIAYRLKNAGLNFNSIEFSIDRYQVDNYYSKYYDPTTQKYLPGVETTFDYLPTKNVGNIVAHVNYAVNVPFSEINGKPLSYVKSKGGLDGMLNFSTGDTLVFYKQENFANAGLYDGWVNYTNSWIGDDITTLPIEGYDSGSYDTYTLIPGYLEKVQGTAPVNQRSGTWTINIVNEIVFLTPTFEVNPNDRVQILSGKTFRSSVLYYDPILRTGQSVPTYRTFNSRGVVVGSPTTFNHGTTRFISNRDQYYKPRTQDKYLKFPQTGVFK